MVSRRSEASALHSTDSDNQIGAFEYLDQRIMMIRSLLAGAEGASKSERAQKTLSVGRSKAPKPQARLRHAPRHEASDQNTLPVKSNGPNHRPAEQVWFSDQRIIGNINPRTV